MPMGDLYSRKRRLVEYYTTRGDVVPVTQELLSYNPRGGVIRIRWQ
jgi:hypothetical protein